MSNFINKIQIDKLRHLVGGTFILFFDLFIYAAISKFFQFPYYFGIITILVAALKELFYDKLLKRGNVEVKDFLYTVIPVILVYFSVLITKYYPVF